MNTNYSLFQPQFKKADLNRSQLSNHQCTPLHNIKDSINITFKGNVNDIKGIDKSENTVNIDNLQQHVSKLASIPRNYTNINGLNISADYIKTQWEKLGLEVKEMKFSVDGKEYKNISVSLGPKNADRIIIGAHYDACAFEDKIPQHAAASIGDIISSPKKMAFVMTQSNTFNDKIQTFRDDMHAADDNASSVAGLLELTRLLVEKQELLDKRVDLVAFTLEEPPYFETQNMGSAHYANHVKKETEEAGNKVIGMIALDAIGYFSDEPNSQKYPLPFLKYKYGNKGNFIAVIGNSSAKEFAGKLKNNMEKNSTIPVHKFCGSKYIPGLDYSDHRNFSNWCDAVMITDTAFYRNPNYHQHTDTPETLNYNKLGQVINGLFGAVLQVSLPAST